MAKPPDASKVSYDRRPKDWEALRPQVTLWAAEGRSLAWMMRQLGYTTTSGNSSTRIRKLIPEEYSHAYRAGGHNRIEESYESASAKATGLERRIGAAQGIQVRVKRLYLQEHPERCASCGIGAVWEGKALVLQLDHVNGDWRDYRRENLRLLCPNCHLQETHQAHAATRKVPQVPRLCSPRT